MCAAEVLAQMISANTSPLGVPTSPRSVAMGESFVALHGNPTALMSNPAGLAGLAGIGLSYAQRSLNWTRGLEDFKYHSGNGYVEAPFGVFGIQYNRLSMGEFAISTPESPDGIGRERVYQHAIMVGFGTKVSENLSAGLAAKYYDIVNTVISNSTPYEAGFSTTPAYLFDAGAQYTVPVFPDDSVLQNAVTAGISLQNIGTKLKSSSSLSSIEYESSAEAPRYLRVGFSLQLKVMPRRTDGLEPAVMVLTGEYRRMLDGSIYGDAERDYWGFGVEFALFEVVSVRMGGVINPFTSIYGAKGKFMTRGGIGVQLPLAELGVPVPLSVSGGYALIPIDRYPNSYMMSSTDNLSAFSIGLEYTYAPQ